MTQYILDGHQPNIVDKTVSFIAENADLIGKVIVKKGASIWFGAVLRGDNEPITIGEGSNVQDQTIIHTDMGVPVTIGENCTIGHRALLHGCQIGNNCLIGMGAIVMNHAEIGENSLVAAGALVTEGKKFPPRSLIVGVPATVKRELSDEEVAAIADSAKRYQENGARYLRGLEAVTYYDL